MDKEIFVQNIQMFSGQKGVSPTAACRESGVGKSFISDLKRDRTPSVDKVQALAQYLEVTTSELLGETPGPASEWTGPERELLAKFRQLNQEGGEVLVDYADYLIGSGKYSKKSCQPGLGEKEA